MEKRINSPEQLNGIMKVSRLRIWVVLGVLFIAVVLGLVWFLTSEVVISERYPCLVSDNTISIAECLYELTYAETGSEEAAQIPISDEYVEYYGKELMERPVQMACLFIKDVNKTEIIERMELEVSNHKGMVLFLPTQPSTAQEMMNRYELSDKEMRNIGMDSATKYYQIIVGVYADNDEGKLKPGLYNASVIIDIIRPSDMIRR